MANVTKQAIINEISRKTGLTQSDVKIAVEEFLAAVSEILTDGKTIEIRGFGAFLTKTRKPRPARNPKTGEVVPLLERVVPLFKFSSELKQLINSPAKGNAPAESQPSSAKESSEIY